MGQPIRPKRSKEWIKFLQPRLVKESKGLLWFLIEWMLLKLLGHF